MKSRNSSWHPPVGVPLQQKLPQGYHWNIGRVKKIKRTKRLTEKRISSTKLFQGHTINLRLDIVELPDGRQAQREVVEHPGAVAVVPLLDDETVILVNQYRAPIERITLEIPAGKLEPGESPEICAARELEEETGYRAEKFELKGAFYTTPGFSNEIMYLFVASGLTVAKSHPDIDEFVETRKFNLKELLQMVKAGEIIDAKTLVGIYTVAAIGSNQGD